MKVALLCRASGSLEERYPRDFIGRDDASNDYDVRDALIKLGHDVTMIRMDLGVLNTLRNKKFDIVFNACDDGFGNNAQLEPNVPALLEMVGLPYTGSNYLTLGLCLDKARTKEILSYNKVPTPKFQLFSSADVLNPGLGFPLIVKPSREDGSIGIRSDSIVWDNEFLGKKVSDVIERYEQPALVEEFIDGREINVALLGNEPHVLPLSEVTFKNGQTIVTYEAKWVENSRDFGSTPTKCPANLDKSLESRIKSIAKKAYKTMGLLDYGRVDFRIDKQNNPYVIEVNPNPDITTQGGLAKSAAKAGISYASLIGLILTSACLRAGVITDDKTEDSMDKIMFEVLR